MGRWASLVGLSAAVLASLGVSLWRSAGSLSDQSLDALAAAVREVHQQGDLIVVTPRTVYGPRQRLGDLDLIQPRQLHPDELIGYRRAHLIEVAALGSADATQDTILELATVVSQHSWPGVDWSVLQISQRQQITFDLRRDLERVAVRVRYADGVDAPCATYDRDRWNCPRNASWNYVGRETRDIDGDPRQCVWLHPVAAGGTLHLMLPVQGPSSDRRLVGAMGFTTRAARDALAPVRFRIFAGDRSIVDLEHPVGPTWARFDAPARSGHLRVEIDSRNNGVGHFCATLKLVEPELVDD